MNDLSLKIRVPSEIKVWLENRSVRNIRSMNGEVLNLLREAKSVEGKTLAERKEENVDVASSAQDLGTI